MKRIRKDKEELRVKNIKVINEKFKGKKDCENM